MTFQKVARIARFIEAFNFEQRARLYGNSNGELCIAFSSQPHVLMHQFFIKNGFILDRHDYIYRPR